MQRENGTNRKQVVRAQDEGSSEHQTKERILRLENHQRSSVELTTEKDPPKKPFHKRVDPELYTTIASEAN